jgi:hypothetical protein
MHPTTLNYQKVPILRDFVRAYKDYFNPTSTYIRTSFMILGIMSTLKKKDFVHDYRDYLNPNGTIEQPKQNMQGLCS